MPLRPPEPGRRGACDSAEGELGIVRCRGRRALRERGAKVGEVCVGCCGQWRAEQDDAEIGVGSDRGQCRVDRAEDAERRRGRRARQSGAADASALRTNSDAVMRWPDAKT